VIDSILDLLHLVTLASDFFRLFFKLFLDLTKDTLSIVFVLTGCFFNCFENSSELVAEFKEVLGDLGFWVEREEAFTI